MGQQAWAVIGGLALIWVAAILAIIALVWRWGHLKDKRNLALVTVDGCQASHLVFSDLTVCEECGARWDTNDDAAICPRLVERHKWILE